jgi:lipoyl synthase
MESSLTPVAPGIRDDAGAGRPITFYAPGLKRHITSEFTTHDPAEFVSISLTGTACALGCDHCDAHVLRGMTALPRLRESLFDLCARAKARGARGVLISGGCDAQGRVPLRSHFQDLLRIRRELGLRIRVHPGLPDEATCASLGEVGIDGAMIDVIGHEDTIREVYHLDAHPADYEAALTNLERYGVPVVPHIVLGLHYGRLLGEWNALEMIARHKPKLLVLVVLMPLTGTPMAGVTQPDAGALGGFFRTARQTLPGLPIMLGCARPLGRLKQEIDRAAIEAGFDGIAYPAEGTVAYAREHGRPAHFINACCGVAW